MPRIPLSWLAEHVEVPVDATAEQVAADLVSVGLEEEAIYGAQVTGPLVIGRVLNLVKEPQKNGKTINWCRIDVGPEHNEEKDNPKFPQPGDEVPSRGIICGAHNFVEGDLVVVALPGTTLPGPFPIAGRKTYGHFSDGMMCSTAELGLGEDSEDGIIVLGKGIAKDISAQPGDDAIELFGLGEQVVEINVTPDRGYCFSMRGVAREYSHATGAKFADPVAEVQLPSATDNGFPVELADDAPIRDHEGCTRYVAQLVTGVDAAASSPAWMQQRLSLAGMRPISLIVDVANYVMLDLGQPLHTFDADKLEGPIVVRRAHAGETLETLDDKVRELNPEDLLISDSKGGHGARAVAIAGVMGGASTEVGPETHNVLLEGASFDRVSIARSARRHRLPSEASKRFERGVDPILPEVAVQRAAELLAEFGGGTIAPERTVVSSEHSERDQLVIELPLDAPSRLIGTDYAPEVISSVLEKIGCQVELDELRGIAEVVPPSWRPDLRIKQDLIEEVARLEGYDQIPSRLPQSPRGRGLTKHQRLRRVALNTLAEAGLVEVFSSPFVGESLLDQLGYDPDDERRDMVRLANPLAETAPFVRNELLPSLIQVAKLNLSRGADSVRVFETSLVALNTAKEAAPVYSAEQAPSAEQQAEIAAALPQQPRRIAWVLAGKSGADNWESAARVIDWIDGIEMAQRVANALGVKVAVRNVQRAPFHPGRCAEVFLPESNQVIGYAGQLHPAAAKELSFSGEVALGELDLDALISAAPNVVRAAAVSTYPVVKEDFAFVVEEEVSAAEVELAIRESLAGLLEQVTLFDIFRGEQIGAGKKSLAFAVRLRSQDGTMEAKEINAAREGCVKAVAAATGATLRA